MFCNLGVYDVKDVSFPFTNFLVNLIKDFRFDPMAEYKPSQQYKTICQEIKLRIRRLLQDKILSTDDKLQTVISEKRGKRIYPEYVSQVSDSVRVGLIRIQAIKEFVYSRFGIEY